MAPHAALNTTELNEKARRDLLRLLEGVRGKKNLVIEQSLAGPVGLFVKFSTLQEYGVDKLFFLENGNVDSSQRNVVFVAHSEKSAQVFRIAGKPYFFEFYNVSMLGLCWWLRLFPNWDLK